MVKTRKEGRLEIDPILPFVMAEEWDEVLRLVKAKVSPNADMWWTEEEYDIDSNTHRLFLYWREWVEGGS